MTILWRDRVYFWSFFLIFSYGFLSVAFGTVFYRLGISGLSISEIIMVPVFISFLFLNKRLFLMFEYPKLIVGLFFLSVLYLAYSISYRSDYIYFIVRQYSFIFYFLCLPVFSALAVYMLDNYKWRFWRGCMVFYFLTMIASLFLVEGNRDGVVLMAVLLVSFYFYSGREVGFLPLCLVLFSGVISGHAGHMVAAIVYFFSVFIFKRPRIIVIMVPFLIALSLLLVPSLLGMEALNDANASWRYKYWSDVFYLVLSSWGGMVGYGFGIEYINPELHSYWDLIGQISNAKYDDLYRSMTTPTHNSFLNVFYHLGWVGFLMVALVLVLPLYRGVKNSDGVVVGGLLVIFLHMMSHNAIELPYMAIPLFFLWSMLIVMSGGERESIDIS